MSYKEIPPEQFNINNLFFYFGETRGQQIPHGKIGVQLCCEDTVKVFENLCPLLPSKDEFTVFMLTFFQHRISRNYIRERSETLDTIILRSQSLKPGLQTYFFDSIRADVNDILKNSLDLRLEFNSKLDKRLASIVLEETDENGADLEHVRNPEHTTPRQVLAMYYIFEQLQVRGIDQTEKARFIEFLTGKNYKNIYDSIRRPLATSTGNLRREDLQYIRPLFENLGLTEIVKSINNELDKPD